MSEGREMLRGWCYFYITFEQIYMGGCMGRVFEVEGGGKARPQTQGLVGHPGKFVFSSSEMETRAQTAGWKAALRRVRVAGSTWEEETKSRCDCDRCGFPHLPPSPLHVTEQTSANVY